MCTCPPVASDVAPYGYSLEPFSTLNMHGSEGLVTSQQRGDSTLAKVAAGSK